MSHKTDVTGDILRISGVNVRKCMRCGKCSATCPSYDAMEYHPHQFVYMVEKGDVEPLLNSKSLYTCLSCFACVERCPRSVQPAKLVEAVRLEVRKAGVPVLAVCPGPVHTGFGDVARRTGKSKKEVPFRKWFYTSVECVVDSAYKAVLVNAPRCYPSLKIRLVALFVRNAPLWLLRAIMSFRPRKAVPAE